MFVRLLVASFLRQRRAKLLAGAAILLGTTAVTAMLALATTIGDRIHRELAVYGANIVVTPKADTLDVKIGGVDLKPATGGAYLRESDLGKLKTIFWANNITGLSPELRLPVQAYTASEKEFDAQASGLWFDHTFSGHPTGAAQLHPAWKLVGSWPKYVDCPPLQDGPYISCERVFEAALGQSFATAHQLKLGDTFSAWRGIRPEGPLTLRVTGVVTTGDLYDNQILLDLQTLAVLNPETAGSLSRVEVSARTKPEDAFARSNPDTLAPKQREIWYCRPYANSIAYQIQEALPGSSAQQVRRVEQSEGTVLARISGLMWLLSAAALLAAGFAVSAAMATAVLERRPEIGLMRSLGAAKGAIAALFYAESGLLALVAGTVGFIAGSVLAFVLGQHIFPGEGAPPLFNGVLLPIVLALALGVAAAGSTPSIRTALRLDPADTLRGAR